MTTLNQEQAAVIIGVSKPTIYTMQANGRLPKPVTEDAIHLYVFTEKAKLQAIIERLNALLPFTTPAEGRDYNTDGSGDYNG